MTLYPSGLLRDHPKMRSEEEVRRAIAGLSPKTAEPQEHLVASRVDPYRVLSLFAGIGGFDLGLERTGGFKTVAFCEIDPFCQRVLSKNWPEVPIYGDVRELTAAKLGADGIVPDVICGGFPCQDISLAGRGAGIGGERSGLWSEYARLVSEIRPALVIVENVAALLGRGLSRVCGDLADIGYDAEWDIIRASDLGAWHDRERLWIVAYPVREGLEGLWSAERIQAQVAIARRTVLGADTSREPWLHRIWQRGLRAVLDGVPDRPTWAAQQWPETESVLCRVDDGIPDRVGRTTAQGNAVVPLIPEILGRAILATANARKTYEREGSKPNGRDAS